MSETLLDIAKKIGVSTATVSRVINKDGSVSSQTRDMVLEELKKSTRNYAKRQITWFSAPRVREYLTDIGMCAGGETRRFEEIVNNARELFLYFYFCDKMN